VEFHGNVVAGETGETVAVECRHVLVQLVADNFRGAVLAGAGGHVFFLDTAKGERERINRGNVTRGAKARAKSPAEGERKRFESEKTIAVTKQVEKHRGPAVPED
jgi:hypothetical protein